jgi:flavin reductase (DIM6/NTAB) family NADH-FMN oxidoreductase RutF
MEFDSRHYRNALGRFPTGIALVTTLTGEGQAIAMTINSFASVSLNPALVLWSLDRSSECLDAFSSGEGYGVHFLREDQQDLSHRFSRKDRHDLSDVSYEIGLGGAPLIRDCHAWLDCRVHARLDGGDHVILIGRVQEFGYQENVEPLLYYKGAYRRLADA